MANEVVFQHESYLDMYYQWDSGGSNTGSFSVGYSAVIGSTESGALRFANVVIPKNYNVSSATLLIKIGSRRGTSPVKSRVYGLDEDNTGDFSSSPGSRDRTTATTTGEYSPTGTGSQTFNVTDIVKEIVARSGWTSGNHLGFWIQDDGTNQSTSNDIYNSYNGEPNDSYLAVRLDAEPNFTPTPVSVSAPAFPEPQSYGLKISKPGQNVFTASENDLYLTTRRKQFKIVSQGQVTTNANPYNIAHGLPYIPFAEVFAKDGTTWYRLPSLSSFDVIGDFSVNATNVSVNTGIGTVLYYYIFIDELST